MTTTRVRDNILCVFITALHFFAHGSYQKSVGKDQHCSVSQSEVSKSLHEIVNILVDHAAANYIQFPRNLADVTRVKTGFFDKFGFPGIVGCIDGTHILIVPPPAVHDIHPGRIYINRNHRHSLNCQITLTNSNVKKAVKSCVMSKRYINTMLRATIINIMYHRLNIDKKEFLTKIFNNIPYKTFRSKSTNILIREFHTYMLACKDALDKNYLREFYLYFINMITGEMIENYKFTFNYAEADEPGQMQKEESLMESTCDLLKILNDLEKHDKPDLEIQVKVEFTYFDDTPEDYEPPGFRSINERDSFMRKIGKSGNSVTLGTLFTGFHMLKCRGRGEVFNYNQTPQLTPDEEGSVVPLEQLETNYEPEGTTQFSTRVAINSPLMTEDMSFPIEKNSTKSGLAKKTTLKINDTYVSDTIEILSDDSDNTTQVDCPCKFPSMDIYEGDRITCPMCKRIYHAACQGYLDKTFVGPNFTCTYCDSDDAMLDAVDAQQSVLVFRVRYLVGILYKNQMLPQTIKNYFTESLNHIQRLNVFPTNGKQENCDISILNTLFKFDFKAPDMNKLKKISL